MSNLPLTPVIEVDIITSPAAVGVQEFDLGLIVGASTVIAAVDRTKLYASVAEMIADGFTATDPEAEAATIYFAQSPQPTNIVIGRWDTTGAETSAEALAACRVSNGDWYSAYVTDVEDAEIEANALVVEAFEQYSIYFADSDSADIPAGTAGNLMETLNGLNYRRTFAEYSAAEYAGAATMGIAMGLTGFDKPSFTMKFKQKIGIAADALTTAEVTAIQNNNGNVYINRSGFIWIENGITPSGIFIDETINLDMLAARIQNNTANLLLQQLKVPQTDSGGAQFISVINSACDEQVDRNAIAPGIWTGIDIGNIAFGDTLPLGYVVLMDSFSTQSQADREARKLPDTSVLAKMAGAVHSAKINVFVNR